MTVDRNAFSLVWMRSALESGVCTCGAHEGHTGWPNCLQRDFAEANAPRPNDLLDILATIQSDPAPLAVDERTRIIDAFKADADAHDGYVDPNRVRAALSNQQGLQVNPRRLAGLYSIPELEAVQEIRSDDVVGRNRGAVIHLYRWVGDAA